MWDSVYSGERKQWKETIGDDDSWIDTAVNTVREALYTADCNNM